MSNTLPRILIIDDLFGRQLKDRLNRERANLCGMYGLLDITGDETFLAEEEVVEPIAEAVFFRAQQPLCSMVGDVVENDLESTVNFVRQGWSGGNNNGGAWSLVLLDLCFYTGQVTTASDKNLAGMPEGRPDDDNPRYYFGLRILKRLHDEFPNLPVIILSSKQRDDEVSHSFATYGALGFISRTDSAGPKKLQDYLNRHGLIPDESGQIIGNSLALLLALRSARRAALNRQNVLIRGERGVGKELLAGYINSAASTGKKSRPLVTVNSGTLNPNLFGSELFGHVKGAYTGADRERPGKISQAHGGDLFLDEIGNMSPDVQNGLLRVLETRLVAPIGADSESEVDVRFITATNEDIELKVATGGGFRADLLDRLREGGTIVLPPLRERKTDIPMLAEHFVRVAERQQGAMFRTISSNVVKQLMDYDWPGNIRELRTCIFDAVNRHPDVEHLVPGHIRFASSKEVLTPVLSTPVAANLQPSLQRHPDLLSYLELQSTVTFGDKNVADWSGRLAELQHAQSWLLARYVQAAVIATKRRTHEQPEGIIQIHPAVKLITGDNTITASKAADVIKRLLGPIEDELKGDLRETYEIAVRLRPKSPINRC